MSFLSLLLIAFGLSMDAFAVSITNGISIKNLQNKHALKIAAFMGGFQGNYACYRLGCRSWI